MRLSEPHMAQIDRAMVCLQTALSAREVYWAEHNAAVGPLREALATLAQVLAERDQITVMLLSDRVVCGDSELPSSASLADALGARALRHHVSCLSFRRGLPECELVGLLEFLASRATDSQPPLLTHIGFGNLRVAGGGAQNADAASIIPVAEAAAAVLRSSRKCIQTVSNFWTTLDSNGCLEARRLEQAAMGVLTFLDSCSGAAIPLAAIERHDFYTAVHTTNVAVLSAALASAVGLPAAAVHDIAIGALLHDIGKQRTSSVVLKKAGRLDDAELAAMRRHPVDGAKMLAATADIPDVAVAITYEHHMHPDGSGYPALSRGRPIHLAGRIVQLADVYDALGTHRPYRRAMDASEIRSTMMAHIGTRYEADLCGLFFDSVIGRASKPSVPPAETPAQPDAIAA